MKVWQGMVVASLSLIVGAGGVGAAPSVSGDIAFTQSVHGRENIWLLDVESKRQWPITHSGAHSPVWSPNGDTIAFVTKNGQLWRMRADGSGKCQLTRAVIHNDSSPVWSLDGSRIAFVRQTADGLRSAIYVMYRDGSHEVNVSGWTSTGGYRSPSWSPDGLRLVYEQFSTGTPTKLLITDLQSKTARELVVTSDEIEAHPQWSPNGKKILFNDSADETYTIWPDGSHRAVISDGDSYSAVWSPSGTNIAFTEEDNSISISGSDGTVTFTEFNGRYQRVRDLAWLPSGNRVIFVATSGLSARQGIFSVDLNNIQSGKVSPSTLLGGQNHPIRQLAPKP